MAREHARIWLDINSDEDFEALTFDAQAVYCRLMLPDATLNYCGVADWRPKRLIPKAADLTMDRLLAAVRELERKRYLLFDVETEEVLVRSFIRRDELLRNPKMAAAVIKAYSAIASKVLRAAVVSEIRRANTEHPEYSSWSHKDTGADLSKLMAKPSLDDVGYANQIGNPDPVPITNRITNQNGNPDPVPNTNQNTETDPGPDCQSKSVPIPSTSTYTTHQHHNEGYVTGERHQGAPTESDGPPPRHCPKHMPGGTLQPCGACAAARREHEDWLAQTGLAQKAAEQAAARAEASRRAQLALDRGLAIANCTLCDDDGYRGSSVCDHVDHAGTNAAGMAAVRAALAKSGDL
ncbi:hypothetical protein E2F47_01825 [Mycobacterium eburneum]|nr:hypothetical protein [Mycobacterium eburneum]TDH57533.1 hypothetical protein E2F47_01825 [Mycobacterium eburneum]